MDSPLTNAKSIQRNVRRTVKIVTTGLLNQQNSGRLGSLL